MNTKEKIDQLKEELAELKDLLVQKEALKGNYQNKLRKVNNEIESILNEMKSISEDIENMVFEQEYEKLSKFIEMVNNGGLDEDKFLVRAMLRITDQTVFFGNPIDVFLVVMRKDGYTILQDFEPLTLKKEGDANSIIKNLRKEINRYKNQLGDKND